MNLAASKFGVSAAAETVEQAISGYASSAGKFSRAYKSLLKQFPDKWVAIYQDDVVASADTLPDVFGELAAKGIPPRYTAIRFVSRKKRTLILFKNAAPRDHRSL
jgi:hypothetical protein